MPFAAGAGSRGGLHRQAAVDEEPVNPNRLAAPKDSLTSPTTLSSQGRLSCNGSGPRPTHPGQGRGVGRTALLLLLVAWLRVATAATICSAEPTACNGTFSGTELCARLSTLDHHMHMHHQRRAAAGSRTSVLWAGGAALGRATGPITPTSAPTGPITPANSARLRQQPRQPGPDRHGAAAAREAHRTDDPVSRRTPAPPYPCCGVGRRLGPGVAAAPGSGARLAPAVPLCTPLTPPPPPPSLREVEGNSLSGTVPPELEGLTKLTTL